MTLVDGAHMSRGQTTMLDFPLSGTGPLSQAAQSLGHARFAEVAEAVRALPYGRTRESQNLLAVLKEQKGTCSSKHRFLAALASECGRTDVRLMIGLYEMSERNTPGVGAALEQEGLPAVLEAHCYLMTAGQRHDFTGLPVGVVSPIESLLEERTVSPADAPGRKVEYHRGALMLWAKARGIDPDHAWAVREACIRMLADRNCGR